MINEIGAQDMTLEERMDVLERCLEEGPVALEKDIGERLEALERQFADFQAIRRNYEMQTIGYSLLASTALAYTSEICKKLDMPQKPMTYDFSIMLVPEEKWDQVGAAQRRAAAEAIREADRQRNARTNNP